jgi:hypothetical protein
MLAIIDAIRNRGGWRDHLRLIADQIGRSNRSIADGGPINCASFKRSALRSQ